MSKYDKAICKKLLLGYELYGNVKNVITPCHPRALFYSLGKSIAYSSNPRPACLLGGLPNAAGRIHP